MYGLALHALDLAVFTALMVLTQGPTSPFFLLFNFSVLAATLKWHSRGAFWTSAAVLVLFLVTGLVFAWLLPIAIQADFFAMRCAQILVIGLMLVYFGRHHERIFEEVRKLNNWPALLPTRESFAADRLPIRSPLAYVAEVFAAPRVLLVWSDPDEPWVYASEWKQQGYAEERLPPGSLEPLLEELAGESVEWLDPATGEGIALSPDGALVRHLGRRLHTPFLERYAIRQTISFPVKGERIEGRLFVLDRPDLSPDDLPIAAAVASRIGAWIERLDALDLWRRAWAAEERLRVARDLHDGVLQVLAGTTLQLEALSRTGPDLEERVKALQRWLIDEQREMRGFIRQLEPGSDRNNLGTIELRPELDSLVQKLSQQWPMVIETAVNPPAAKLPARMRFDLQQLVREAAANAARHGKATQLRIAASIQEDRLRLEIEDDGCGFPFQGSFNDKQCTEMGIGPRSLVWRVERLSGRLRAGTTSTGAHLLLDLPIHPQPTQNAA